MALHGIEHIKYGKYIIKYLKSNYTMVNKYCIIYTLSIGEPKLGKTFVNVLDNSKWSTPPNDVAVLNYAFSLNANINCVYKAEFRCVPINCLTYHQKSIPCLYSSIRVGYMMV